MTDYTVHLYKKRPKKKRKPRTPSRQKLERLLWTQFSLYIRKRDGYRCLMGEQFGGCWGVIQAGHVVPKEDSYNVKWIEDNVFGQCQAHNSGHRYRRSKYNDWFIRTHGAERFTEIQALATRPAKVLSAPQLQAMIKQYKEKLDSL